MKLRHVGIPTESQHVGEILVEDIGVYITDPDADPYGIEWLRFLPDSPLPEELKQGAHLAFEVENLEAALQGKEILIDPWTNAEGAQIAFILHESVPVELMQTA
jgi:hypothetical protein